MPEPQNQQNSQNPQNVLPNALDSANKQASPAQDFAQDSAFSKKMELMKGRFVLVGGKMRGIFGRVASNLSTIITKIKGLNKGILYGASALVALFAVFIILLISFLNKPEPLSTIYAPKPPPAPKSPNATKLQKSNEVQNLLTKAALLSNSGHTLEALGVYDNIAIFSQSFANFNLGVSELKARNFPSALKAFNLTIESGENIASAAINAAKIAYSTGDLKKYNYYVNLAKGTMIEWSDKPLYSYLYSLVNFYDGNYFATLSSLNNPTSNFYNAESALLSAKIYLNFNDEYNALKKLLEVNSVDNRFNVGLLYARMGEYDLAQEQISDFIRDNNSVQANMALALIELKRSQFMSAAEIYNTLMQSYEMKDLSRFYPIKIKLKDALFDVNLAQKDFWDKNVNSNASLSWHYKILFYFAPFQVFDVNNAIASINDGGLELRMDNLQAASAQFASGAMIANIDEKIVRGLKEILRYNINEALNIMREAVQKYPNHQVLQYNLGLIYAQLNDFENARKHFLKAYHLDTNDLLSAIFALMCAQLTQNDTSRIINDINANFEEAHFENSINEAFYRSLFGYANGNITDDMLWLADSAIETPSISLSKTTPLMFALKALYSLGTRDKASISSAFDNLEKRSNNDIIARLLSQLASHYNENIKSFALSLFEFIKHDLNNLDVVVSGPTLARQLYIHSAFLVGANSYVDKVLNDRLLKRENTSGVMSALALNAIYLNDFERAFAYYNELIDVYNAKSAEVYFYAAVSAIGAGHYDNAVALIQLARLDNGSNFEARYALGLLHQTMGNLHLASMQFSTIRDFESDFFDFEIDSSLSLRPVLDSANNAKNAESTQKGI